MVISTIMILRYKSEFHECTVSFDNNPIPFNGFFNVHVKPVAGDEMDVRTKNISVQAIEKACDKLTRKEKVHGSR